MSVPDPKQEKKYTLELSLTSSNPIEFEIVPSPTHKKAASKNNQKGKTPEEEFMEEIERIKESERIKNSLPPSESTERKKTSYRS